MIWKRLKYNYAFLSMLCIKNLKSQWQVSRLFLACFWVFKEKRFWVTSLISKEMMHTKLWENSCKLVHITWTIFQQWINVSDPLESTADHWIRRSLHWTGQTGEIWIMLKLCNLQCSILQMQAPICVWNWRLPCQGKQIQATLLKGRLSQNRVHQVEQVRIEWKTKRRGNRYGWFKWGF